MGSAGPTSTRSHPPRAVLFDRDGTLVRDVPYNGDPARVELLPTVREALDLLRSEGIPVGVVSNQSGVARGLISLEDVAAVNAAVEELAGRFDVWCICPHGPDDGCACRKPRPGLVLDACERLGIDPRDSVVIGDIGADLGAAAAAGARGVLVPTEVTLAPEVLAAEAVASTAWDAVVSVVGTPPARRRRSR